MRILRLLIPVVVAGCVPAQPIDTDTSPPTCAITITNVLPGDAETEVYYRSVLSWEFSERDDTVGLSLVDENGAAIAASAEWVDTTYIRTPDEPLAPDTFYSWTLTYCDGLGVASGTFSTSDVGAPIDPGLLEGATYALDLSTGTWLEPPGVGVLLQSQLERPVLAQLSTQDGVLGVLVSPSEEASNPPVQDLCEPTTAFGAVDLTDNPTFQLVDASARFEIQGRDIQFEDMFASGSFSPGAQDIHGLVLDGVMDTRLPEELIVQPYNPGAVCELAHSFGISCEACPDGQPYCLGMRVTDVAAYRLPDFSLIPRDPATIATDPDCQ